MNSGGSILFVNHLKTILKRGRIQDMVLAIQKNRSELKKEHRDGAVDALLERIEKRNRREGISIKP